MDVKGRKHVIIKFTGFSFMQIIAYMVVLKNDHKSAPLIICKGKESGVITQKTGTFLTTTQ